MKINNPTFSVQVEKPQDEVKIIAVQKIKCANSIKMEYFVVSVNGTDYSQSVSSLYTKSKVFPITGHGGPKGE